MKKILYYLVPLATAFLLCGCLKDMKDGELLHGNREVLISIDLPGELASLDKSGFKVTMRNTKIGNTYTSETDAKGETRIDAERDYQQSGRCGRNQQVPACHQGFRAE